MMTAAFDWRRTLTPDEYRVLREKATEPARSGEYNDLYPTEGYFVCRGCKNPLFSAAAKYKSGCGWPSFDRCYVGSLRVQPDFSHGDQRVEIVCAQCDGHLGHLFSGEHHTESDQRHCVNSRSIKFIKSAPPAELLAVGESTVDTTAVERQLAAHVPAPNGRLADVRPRSDLDLSDPELAAAWAETRALASGWCVCTYAEGSKTQIVPIARGSDGFDGLRAALLEDAINYGVLPLRVDERPRHIFFCYVVDERVRAVLEGACVVELGAGCGLPGLAAAVYARSRRVVLTDLNALTLANLRANVLANADACAAAGCSVETTPKTQVQPYQPYIVGEPVDIVLGSDLAYRTENVRLLGARVRALLATGGIFLHGGGFTFSVYM
ncbi:methionine-r-sulfoxide reductase [Chrysochromulina tobinii]|uniref:Methionine-r-sulfoxide reductase n=1 Tax=Chrysochromulina tobinii TaxID=1460289 RepID=A0A0M0J779_9EUKA|nr:methionine-r-sulfoxide reductase [Chrysochromulina tobinii]|eukprot:KOO22207.1 methionine-r-sulfoxide reductase [Chrysochromulina sp. CCMP291]